jgi:uncharacterized protein (DUF885 family)
MKTRVIARHVVAAAALLQFSCAPLPPKTEPPPPAPPPPTVDQQFDELASRYLREFPELNPVSATALGDHRFDDRINDVSAAGWQARQRFAESYLAALDGIDRAALSRDRQVDALLLRNELEYARFRVQELQDWRWNPLVYTGIAGDALYNLIAREFAPAPERFANLGKRLDEIPRFLSQVREVLEPARVPRVHADTAVRQNGGLISMLDGEIATHVDTLPAAEQESLRASMARARTAISQHQIWLERRLVPEAKGDFRLGAALYDRKLGFALFSPLTRQEIRARAESELAATHRAMYDVAREVLKGRRNPPRLPDEPTEAQRLRAIKAALELAYADRPGREAVLDTARATLAEATQFVQEKGIVTVPEEPLEIIPMPEFQQGVALAYCDSPGPLEANLKTFYAVSPIPEKWTRQQVDSFLREYNTRSIHNLTIHEAMPGHYLQLAHSNRHPSTLRAVLASGPFIEGWAVYSEGVMVQQGYMGGDPLMKLIQLKWYLRSIVNAMLDQAVHVDGITREAAMKLMTESGFQEEREAAGKWTRAQLTSAQLPVYFVGAQEHMALRAEAESRQGAAFDMKAYHDRLLSFGSPPVRFARALLFELPVE